MKIFLPPRIGFCSGVKKTIRLAELALKKGQQVYSLGDLVHNPEVIRSLIEKGMRPISSLDEVQEGTVITRSHGIDPALIRKGQEKGLKMVDTTCSYVLKVQKIAKFLQKESYQLIIVGSRRHPEIEALTATLSSNRVHVINNPREVRFAPTFIKAGIVAQTTEGLDNFTNIIKNLIQRQKSGELRIFNTICRIVRERQSDVQSLANKVEAMIIVGGRNSSNTQQMVNLCRRMKVKTYFLEKETDLNLEELTGFEKVGISGGTSTPGETIYRIKQILLSFGKRKEYI